MKKALLILMLMALMSPACLFADDFKLVDALDLRIINKGFDNTERPYWRLPANLKDSCRPDLWNRQQCSAGIAVRFATDSRSIGVKYSLLFNAHMLHMADTGIKGTDLYILEGDSVWRHVNTNRPRIVNDSLKLVEATYVSNLDGAMHEYMIYMPLYDGVENLYVKVDKDARITPGNPAVIDSSRKIMAYGTSILQGGCASRTGMAATNIIGRELNAEVVNLGFSGEGKMDSYIASTFAAMDDVDLFLLDPIPNCTEMMCDTLTYDFVKTIAAAHPNTPVVYVAGPIYPYARYDSHFGNYLPKKNAAALRNIKRLQDEGFKNIYWIDSVNLDGPEDDGTVDGIHLTDLGFRHYADHVLPLLKQLTGW